MRFYKRKCLHCRFARKATPRYRKKSVACVNRKIKEKVTKKDTVVQADSTYPFRVVEIPFPTNPDRPFFGVVKDKNHLCDHYLPRRYIIRQTIVSIKPIVGNNRGMSYHLLN